MDVVPFLVAIARCYCRTANFGGVDVVAGCPVCYGGGRGG